MNDPRSCASLSPFLFSAEAIDTVKSSEPSRKRVNQ